MERSSRLLWVVWILLGFWVVVALAAPLLAPFDPWQQHLETRFAPPGTLVKSGDTSSPGGSKAAGQSLSGDQESAGVQESGPGQDSSGARDRVFWLGTDSLGRDILSRLIFGARAALFVGTGALLISVLAGGVLGGLAGSFGGRVEGFISLVTDAILAVPTVLLAIALVAVLGSGQLQMVISLGVVFTPVITRLVRSEVKKAKNEGWVVASRVLGTPGFRAFRLHILPQVGPAVAIQASSLFSLAISLEASLSFLGIGSQPPEASWGLMLQEARNYLLTHGSLALAPGICLALVVLVLNLLGDLIAESFHR